MKKLALLVALLMILGSVVYADPPEGHLDYSQQPWLSEAAVDNDPAGTAPILFMVDLSIYDVEIIPDFKIRIVDVWATVEVTDTTSYSIDDGTIGNEITNSFNTTTVGVQRVSTLRAEYAEIDPGAGESISITTGGGSTAEAHLYFMAVRVL